MNKFQEINHNKLTQTKPHNPKKCKYCKEWYKGTIELTKKLVKDKDNKEMLLAVWEILWLNNCSDFDIIESVMEGWIKENYLNNKTKFKQNE